MDHGRFNHGFRTRFRSNAGRLPDGGGPPEGRGDQIFQRIETAAKSNTLVGKVTSKRFAHGHNQPPRKRKTTLISALLCNPVQHQGSGKVAMLNGRLKYNIRHFVPVVIKAINTVDDLRLDAAAAMDETSQRLCIFNMDNPLKLIEQFVFALRRNRGPGPGNSIAEGRDTSVQAGCKYELRATDNFTHQFGRQPFPAHKYRTL